MEVVLERSSSQEKSVGGLKLTDYQGQLGLFVLDPKRLQVSQLD